LENQPQPSSSIRISVQQVNIIKPPFIRGVDELMEETFFGFFRLNTVITYMLDIPILSVFIIPLKPILVRFRHRSLLTILELRGKYHQR